MADKAAAIYWIVELTVISPLKVTFAYLGHENPNPVGAIPTGGG